MKKIVINACYGGFGLSKAGVLRYAELKGIKLYCSSNSKWYTAYYTVPEEEYKRLYEEDKNNIGNYGKSNSVCFRPREIKRDDPILILVIEELGKKANGDCANLKVVKIPDDVEWEIQEYDGHECVAEQHRTWS